MADTKYNLPTSVKPVNYSAPSKDIDTHLKGIDKQLGVLKPSAKSATFTVPTASEDAAADIAAILVALGKIKTALQEHNII